VLKNIWDRIEGDSEEERGGRRIARIIGMSSARRRDEGEEWKDDDDDEKARSSSAWEMETQRLIEDKRFAVLRREEGLVLLSRQLGE
jgi:hypothetical protein